MSRKKLIIAIVLMVALIAAGIITPPYGGSTKTGRKPQRKPKQPRKQT